MWPCTGNGFGTVNMWPCAGNGFGMSKVQENSPKHETVRVRGKHAPHVFAVPRDDETKQRHLESIGLSGDLDHAGH